MFTRLKKASAGIALVIAGAMSLSACSGSDSSSDSYSIGAVIPLSGANQQYGELYEGSIKIGLDYVNEHMNLKKKVVMHYGDGQALPSPSVTAMNKLANVDKVEAVLSGFSAPVKAISSIADQKKVALFNGGASSPDLQNLGKYIINNIPLANQQVPPIVNYVVKTLGLKKIAVAYSNETLGQSMLKALKKDIPAAGGDLVDQVSVNTTATEFGSQVTKLSNDKPEAIFFAMSSAAQTPILAKELRDNGVTAQILSYAGTDTPAALAEPAMEGALFTAQHIDFKANDPVTEFYVKEFAKRNNGGSPNTLAVNYYSLIILVGQVIGDLEKSGTDVTGANIIKTIHSVKTFDSLGGKVTFSNDGTVQAPIDVRKISNGATSIVTTVQPGKN